MDMGKKSGKKTLKTFYFTKAPTWGMLVQHFNKQ